MNIAGVITVDVRDTLALDQNVFDSVSTKVGEITFIDSTTGWFTIAPSILTDEAYFVPFTLITYIDPHEVFLGVTKEELQRAYTSPPPRQTSVEDTVNPTATTTQPSGYGPGSVVVHTARVNEHREAISTGYRVFTSDMVDIGTVREYDRDAGLMVLGKGPFAAHEVVVPITVVASVDKDLEQVNLVISRADLQNLTPVSLVRTGAVLAGRS